MNHALLLKSIFTKQCINIFWTYFHVSIQLFRNSKIFFIWTKILCTQFFNVIHLSCQQSLPFQIILQWMSSVFLSLGQIPRNQTYFSTLMNFLIIEDLFSKHLNPYIKVKNNKLPLLQSYLQYLLSYKAGVSWNSWVIIKDLNSDHILLYLLSHGLNPP